MTIESKDEMVIGFEEAKAMKEEKAFWASRRYS